MEDIKKNKRKLKARKIIVAVLVITAFVLSNFAGNSSMKPFVFISLLLSLPQPYHNKIIVTLFISCFIYEMADMFVLSKYIFTASYGWLIFALGISAILSHLICLYIEYGHIEFNHNST